MMFFLNRAYGGAHPPFIGFVSGLALTQKMGCGLRAVCTILLAMLAYIPGASANTPSALGCPDGAASCQLPSGNTNYTFTLSNGNRVDTVRLPESPREGNRVVVNNNATARTKVAVDGANGDGVPLAGGKGQTFVYRKSAFGALQWDIEPVYYDFFAQNPLPSFHRGAVTLDVDRQDNPNMPTTLDLPANPAEGSSYRLYLNHSSPQSVTINLGSGSGNVTLSASRKEAIFAVSSRKWMLVGSPAELGCNGNGIICQLPSGYTSYMFSLRSGNWGYLVKLPASPREGDRVTVTNAGNTTRVAVDGIHSDGLPLQRDQQHTFVYRQSASGALQWDMEPVPYNYFYDYFALNPLPSFHRGAVTLDVDPQDNAGIGMPTTLDLPAYPAEGSSYHLYLNHDNPQSVTINPGSGSGNITLSASRREAVFTVNGGKWIVAGTPSLLGCPNGAASCQLPSGYNDYWFTLSDGNSVGLVKLPASPREGDRVTVTNNAGNATRVAVDGTNGDGLPFQRDQQRTFVYRKSAFGALQWDIEPVFYNFFAKNPLPSFHRGAVTLDVDPQDNTGMPTTLNLPANPAEGSSYHLYLNHDNPQSVTINLGSGSGNVTLSASRREAIFAVSNMKWMLVGSPAELGCNNNGAVCQLPSGYTSYMFSLRNGNWGNLVKLPASPREGDRVVVNNNASMWTPVAVDGTNGDGVPLDAGRGHLFTYRKSASGALQWDIEPAYYYLFNQNPLPSFHRGAVTLDVDPQDNTGMPTTLNLPANPAEGSSYRLYLNHASPQSVTINLGSGSGNVTLSASRREAIFAVSNRKWMLVGSPAELGCNNNGAVCQLPSGYTSYMFSLRDANWASIVKLPASPREGDRVVVNNHAGTRTRVAVDGTNGDGVPLDGGKGHTFVYRKSAYGALQWDIDPVFYNFFAQNPLPSFHRGAVTLDVDRQDNPNMPTTLDLPANPAEGSSYRLYLDHASPQSVTINLGSGSGSVTLSASRREAIFAVDGGKWIPAGSPVGLGCNNNNGGTCQLPSGYTSYMFSLSDGNSVGLVKLPASPSEGDKVTVNNKASTATKVTVDGTHGIPITTLNGSMVFTYQRSPMGQLIWAADAKSKQGAYCANAGAPCTLPPFNAGMVQMVLSSAGANRFDLPANPADGSIYELTANTLVWVNSGSGANEMALGQTRLYHVVNRQWQQMATLDTTPADLGCQYGTCRLPAGLDSIALTLTDSNNSAHVQLPSAADEGDVVQIDNKQSDRSVRVSVTGMEGVPVGPNQFQRFIFQQTKLGVAQWAALGHLDQICPSTTPCSLPTFSNGYLQYSGTNAIATRVTLPSTYDMTPTGIELVMASDATNLILVENGGGLFTLSAAENPQLVFKSVNYEWQPLLTNSPKQLHCENSNVCQLPDGKPNYVFELSNRDRVPLLKLPVKPVMGQEVLIKNHSHEPTYVSVTGRSGDGLAVAGGSQLRFTYRQSDAKLTQWVADKVRPTHCSSDAALACELHSFEKGYAHLDLTGLPNRTFTLPRAPLAGSIYVVSNNNEDGSTTITGAGNMTLGAKELRQFYVKDGAWDYDHAQNGFDPTYHEIKELTVLYNSTNGASADIYANGNMRTPVTVMVKVFDRFTQRSIDIYNTPGLVKLYDHSVGTGTNRNSWIIPDENPVGPNYMLKWQAFTKPNDFDSILSGNARNAVTTVESQIAAMSRTELDEYSRFNLYVSSTKSEIKNLCVRFGTSTVYRDSCADGPNTINKATIRALLSPNRNGTDFTITPSRGPTDGYAVAWSLMLVPNNNNGRFRVHSVSSKPARSLTWIWTKESGDTVGFNPSIGEWNDNVWGLVDMRHPDKQLGSRALYLKRPGVLQMDWAGYTEKANGKSPSHLAFTDDPSTDDGYLYFGVMQGGECGERDQRSVNNTQIGYDHRLENKGNISFLDNYGNTGLISFRPDDEMCGGYIFN